VEVDFFLFLLLSLPSDFEAIRETKDDARELPPFFFRPVWTALSALSFFGLPNGKEICDRSLYFPLFFNAIAFPYLVFATKFPFYYRRRYRVLPPSFPFFSPSIVVRDKGNSMTRNSSWKYRGTLISLLLPLIFLTIVCEASLVELRGITVTARSPASPPFQALSESAFPSSFLLLPLACGDERVRRLKEALFFSPRRWTCLACPFFFFFLTPSIREKISVRRPDRDSTTFFSFFSPPLDRGARYCARLFFFPLCRSRWRSKQGTLNTVRDAPPPLSFFLRDVRQKLFSSFLFFFLALNWHEPESI